MSQCDQATRRQFLSTSARAAAVAGLALGGCQQDGRTLGVVGGPRAPRIDPDQVIRLGCVGVGGRGKQLLRRFLDEPKVEVVAVADLSEEARQEALKIILEKGGKAPDFYAGPDDYKDKLLAREDIDAVVLATPCYLHTPMYLDCFAAGKHFYGEKPMSITVAETDAMIAAQKKNPGVIAQIGFQHRCDPIFQESIRRIHDGMIGRPFGGYGAYNLAWGPAGLPGDGARVWFGRRAMSGDWHLEQACHAWDVYNWMAGALPVAASGMGRRDIFDDLDPQRDVTDYYIANIEYPDDFMLDFEHTWAAPSDKHDPQGIFNGVFERVIGPKGGITMSAGQYFPRDPDGEPVQWAEGRHDGTPFAIRAFLNALRTDTKPLSGVYNGRKATLVGLLVRKATDERRRVEMKEIAGGPLDIPEHEHCRTKVY